MVADARAIVSAMTASLRRGAAAWWRLGPITGTRTAAQAALRIARAPARRARLSVAPLRARPGEVRRALGVDPVAALRGPAVAALPSVADLEARVATLDRTTLLERADAVVAHRFDLLGSGPVDLGPRIDWLADFKTGRRWPLAHISQVPIVFGDGSDIKVPWELSRCQHLPLLAAVYRLTGEALYLNEIGAQIESFIAANPVEFGPNWACTMDVAIRAANWVAALAMVADARPPWLERAVGSLLLHGRFIRSHLEWGEVRGNHYLSDVVGLLPVAALFSGSDTGRRWAEWAAAELIAEMEHQVRPDGCDHEASIPYHRLVTELFVCGTQAVDALLPGRLPDAYRDVCKRCCSSPPPTRVPTASRRWSATTIRAGSCRSTSTAATTARTCTCSPRRASSGRRATATQRSPTAASGCGMPESCGRSSAAVTSASTVSAVTPTTTR